MKYAAVLFAIIGVPAFGLDGGGSSTGPGTPQIEYICKDVSDNVEVLIGKFYPDYVELITVMTVVPMLEIADKNVRRIPGDAPGANLVYRGKRFEVSIITDGPSYRADTVAFRAELKDFLRDKVGAEPRALAITCEPR